MLSQIVLSKWEKTIGCSISSVGTVKQPSEKITVESITQILMDIVN